jgi:hypothetical protein
MKIRRYAIETELVGYATNKRDAAVQAMQNLLGGNVGLGKAKIEATKQYELAVIA